MATTSPPFGPTAPALLTESWRDRMKITRTGIFAAFFLIVGVALLVVGPRTYTGETITTLTFGASLPSIAVPTLSYALVVGVLFVVGGVVGLLPTPALGGRATITPGTTRKQPASVVAAHRLRNLLLVICGILIIPTVLIIAAAGQSTNVTVMLQVSLRLSTPIALGALAGIWSERSGVANIGIEGMMLTGACFGFVALTLLAPSLGSQGALWAGVLVAILAGGAMAALHAWLSLTFRTDQIVSGTVINILAVGITSFLRREVLFSSEAGRDTLQVIPIQFLGLDRIPVVSDVLFTGRPIFYAMFILIIATHIILFYTRWGLRVRAVGENPHAADTLGINVLRVRWVNVLISGMIAGLGGAWFSLETTGSFTDNMTSGRGFIGLAAMIFGKYMPFGAFGGAALFGFSDALGQRFQFLGVPIPPQFLQMVPYVITIIVLAGLVGRAVAPKADGVPYEKEGK